MVKIDRKRIVSALMRAFVTFFIMVGIVLSSYVGFYFWIKSLSYNWDEKGFIGKKLEGIAQTLPGRRIDFDIKGFVAREVEKYGLVYGIELRFSWDEYTYRNKDARIITGVQNFIMFQPDYLGEVRIFSKRRFSGSLLSREYEEIMMRFLWYRVEIKEFSSHLEIHIW